MGIIVHLTLIFKNKIPVLTVYLNWSILSWDFCYSNKYKSIIFILDHIYYMTKYTGLLRGPESFRGFIARILSWVAFKILNANNSLNK